MVVGARNADVDNMKKTNSIYEFAEIAFGDSQKAERWLRKPKRQFAGLTPLEMLDKTGGEARVRELLKRINVNATPL